MTTPFKRDASILERCRALFAERTPEEAYLPVNRAELGTLVHQLDKKEVNLSALFASDGLEGRAGLTLFYVLEALGASRFVVLRHEVEGPVASAARHFPTASWYEREIRDGFGLEFTGAFDERRLFLHEAYPADFHPLLKSVPATGPVPSGPAAEPYRFRRFQGEGVYEIPVGPVHAGIIEPGHFRFSVTGETVLGLEIRMFYKHRGLEKAAEGKTPEAGVALAESISGDESAANATAYCLAVERISGQPAPVRAQQLRTVLLEMERIYSHLGDLAGMITDVAYPVGAAEFYVLREELLRLNQRVSGSRFLKGMLVPGGLRRDVPAEALHDVVRYLIAFEARFGTALRLVYRSPSVIDRLETTGIIPGKLVRPLNLSGPAARAAGAAADTRTDHPYGRYPVRGTKVRTRETGDVLARFEVKAEEITDSVAAILSTAREVEDGPVTAALPARDGQALAAVEAPRGQSLHWVCIEGGVISRYKVRTASFCNWQAIEHAVLGNIVPDFPLINKSLNLSYAGTDL